MSGIATCSLWIQVNQGNARLSKCRFRCKLVLCRCMIPFQDASTRPPGHWHKYWSTQSWLYIEKHSSPWTSHVTAVFKTRRLTASPILCWLLAYNVFLIQDPWRVTDIELRSDFLGTVRFISLLNGIPRSSTPNQRSRGFENSVLHASRLTLVEPFVARARY